MPFLETSTVRFHYYIFGAGPEIMLAFHGFGMRGTQFHILEDALSSKYTIYSFDLFFHGETELFDASYKKVKAGYSAETIRNVFSGFIASIATPEQKISLLAYSMGALLAWAIIGAMPERIANAYFIAPDGIRPNKLLKFGAQNKVANWVFWRMAYSPKTLNFILRQMLSFKYIDEALYRILLQEFGTEKERLACYNSITYNYSAQLNFSAGRLAGLLNDYNITSYFYFGIRDKLFPASIGTDFAKLLNKTNLHIFDSGHELVNLELNTLIKQQLSAHDER